MSDGKRNSKRKGRTKAVTVLGVAGALSLAGGASGAAVGPPGDTLMANTAVILDEEEIFDVSLSTFYAFDRENAGARHPGLRLAQRSRSRPRQGSAGAEDCAGGGPTCCASCASDRDSTAMRLQDEAGRIAVNIAKLPELMRKP
jgi:hypothetical protein